MSDDQKPAISHMGVEVIPDPVAREGMINLYWNGVAYVDLAADQVVTNIVYTPLGMVTDDTLRAAGLTPASENKTAEPKCRR